MEPMRNSAMNMNTTKLKYCWGSIEILQSFFQCNFFTVMSIHLLWNQEPQHPKNASMNIIVPTAMAKESALRRAY